MNIIQRIKQIVNSIRQFLKGIPDDVKQYAEIALQVTTKIKQVIDSPVVVTITELTPTDVDDNIRAQLSGCLQALTEWLQTETLEDAVNRLRHMNKKMQNAVLVKLASEITACLDNNEMKESNYDIAVQAVYSSSKDNG